MSIHESSIIHPSSEIDDDVEIGPFCIIGEKVKIKSGSKLLSHVVLKGPTTVGKNNIFYQFLDIHIICAIYTKTLNIYLINKSIIIVNITELTNSLNSHSCTQSFQEDGLIALDSIVTKFICIIEAMSASHQHLLTFSKAEFLV